VVIDSSTLISLARAGLLDVLSRLPGEVVILDVVWDEVVVAGRSGQHADAIAIEHALDDRPRRRADPAKTVDESVLLAAREDGTLVCNDLTLGRRARNVGARWVRTADLLVLQARSGSASGQVSIAGIEALFAAGRISEQLRDDYLETLT
jgi:predicted nucleic acid-binding protein